MFVSKLMRNPFFPHPLLKPVMTKRNLSSISKLGTNGLLKSNAMKQPLIPDFRNKFDSQRITSTKQYRLTWHPCLHLCFSTSATSTVSQNKQWSPLVQQIFSNIRLSQKEKLEAIRNFYLNGASMDMVLFEIISTSLKIECYHEDIIPFLKEAIKYHAKFNSTYFSEMGGEITRYRWEFSCDLFILLHRSPHNQLKIDIIRMMIENNELALNDLTRDYCLLFEVLIHEKDSNRFVLMEELIKLGALFDKNDVVINFLLKGPKDNRQIEILEVISPALKKAKSSISYDLLEYQYPEEDDMWGQFTTECRAKLLMQFYAFRIVLSKKELSMIINKLTRIETALRTELGQYLQSVLECFKPFSPLEPICKIEKGILLSVDFTKVPSPEGGGIVHEILKNELERIKSEFHMKRQKLLNNGYGKELIETIKNYQDLIDHVPEILSVEKKNLNDMKRLVAYLVEPGPVIERIKKVPSLYTLPSSE